MLKLISSFKKFLDIFLFENDGKNYIGCLAHELHHQLKSIYVRECSLALDPMVATYKISKSDIPKFHPVVMSIFPLYFYELTDCYQSASTGLIKLGNNDLIVQEFSWGWGKKRTSALWPKWSINTKIINNKNGVYVCSGRGYHGIVDDLTHICFFSERLKNSTIIIDESNKWLYGLVNALFPTLKLELVKPRTLVNSSNLYATTKAPLAEFIHPRLLVDLKKYVGLKLGIQEIHEKIFVSRAKSKNRYWDGELELEKKLEGMGFYIARLEIMSVVDQVRLFMGAKVIVGRHGAGLANICFCQFKIVVIEIFESEHFNACYSSMAAALGHTYKSVRRLNSKEGDKILVQELVDSLAEFDAKEGLPE